MYVFEYYDSVNAVYVFMYNKCVFVTIMTHLTSAGTVGKKKNRTPPEN